MEGCTSPDRLLLNAFVGGDLVAFERLFERHRAWLLRRCRNHVGGDALLAEDCMQETMLALARSAASITGGVPAWLQQTASNICASRLRREMRWARAGVARPEVLDDDAGPHSGRCAMSDHVSLRSAMVDAISLLPPRQREVLVLRHVHDLSQHAIALRVGLSEGAVESLLHRARQRLRTLLDDGEAA